MLAAIDAGASGLAVPPFSMGAMSWDDSAQEVFHAYLDAGGTVLDTAVNYGTEELLGRLVAESGPPGQVLVEPQHARTRQFLQRILDPI